MAGPNEEKIMKVCHYSRQTIYGQQKRLGLFFNESTIIDVNNLGLIHYENLGFYNAFDRASIHFPAKLSSVLKLHPNPIDFFQNVFNLYLDYAKKGILTSRDGTDMAFDLKDDRKAKLNSPIDQINCYRDFYTHERHVKVGFEKRNEPIPKAWYEMPVYYKGSTLGFIGHRDDIIWPNYTDILDFELELGCVLMKDGKNIKTKDAYKHIFGFTILNDISARDIQKKEMQVRLGPAKGKDFCSVLGPVITTIDEFNYAEPDLLMTAKINGDEWSSGRSSEANFTWAEMIEHASREEWLVATDLLGSGTVGSGCGLELDRWIQPGDKIELYIEKIGTLTNIVSPKNKES